MMTQEISRETVAHQILQTIPRVMQILAGEVRRSELTVLPAHFRLMLMLSRCPSSLSDLAESQDVSLPTISRTVSTLVERGWVSHRASPSDRRVVIAELTPAGRKVLADIRAQTLARLEEMLARLSQEELDKLACACEVLEDVLPALAPPWTE